MLTVNAKTRLKDCLSFYYEGDVEGFYHKVKSEFVVDTDTMEGEWVILQDGVNSSVALNVISLESWLDVCELRKGLGWSHIHVGVEVITLN